MSKIAIFALINKFYVMSTNIILFIILLIVSIFLTGLIRKFALKKNILDTPNERSSHTTPIPRGGGLAIILTWFAGIIYLFLKNQIDQNLFYALLSGGVLAIVSLIDDVIDLKPVIRMLAQSISAFLALFYLGGIHLFQNIDNQVLFWLINSIVFIGIIWFINLFNFLDGIDAYASQEAIMVALGMFIIVGDSVFGILVVAVGGFLIWNWPKAKIFMGDIGSTQLGFILIVLGIYYHNTNEFNITNWVILTSIFWFDATFTLYRRWRNHEKLSIAHKKHAYQRLNQSGFSHLKVNVYAIGLNIFLIAVVWINNKYLEQGIFILVLIVVVLFLIMRWIDKRFPFKRNTK